MRRQALGFAMNAPTPSTYSPAELAGLLLFRSEPAFRRRWRKLQSAHGFPPPLPGCNLVWSRLLVDAWIEAGGLPAAAEGEPAPRPAKIVERQREALEARYTARAA
jgi:hypothetical protein